MKILHTSDWHLGHQLYGYDRTEEQEDMLNQIVEIVRKEKPDVFLLCGDVFHVPQPSAAVQKMFVNAIQKIRNANSEMRIVVTAGNHDSGSRHEIFRIPWNFLGVEVVGTLRQDNPEEHIIELKDKGFIVAIPYVNDRFLPDDYFENLSRIIAERNVNDLPVVMTAHTTVIGADFTGHEQREDSVIGGIEGTRVEKFGHEYDYLALGHIHHEQFVHTGHHNVRYSGSPLAISFDEDFPHSVSMVEIEKHRETPKVTKIEIKNPRPLVTFPEEGFTEWENAKKILQSFEGTGAYIRLNVETDNFLQHGASDEARIIAESKNCRFCVINSRRKREPIEKESGSLTVSEFREMDPLEIAKRYIEGTGGIFSEEMGAMFKEIKSIINTHD